MIYVAALLAGLAGAVAGWAVAAALGGWIAGLCGMSDFEGGRGMFAAFVVGPAGGLLAMLAAITAVLRRGGGRSARADLLPRLLGVLAGLAALVAGGIWLRLATLDTYTDRLPPQLEFELRVPAALAGATPAGLAVRLDTDKNAMPADLDAAWRDEGAARVIGGRLSLDFKTTARILVVALPGQPPRLFRLRLARDPDATPALGDWRPPDFLDVPDDARPRPAPPDDPVAVRVGVRRP
ncbi:MAG: hypothetical protein U0802_20565 [Candidatus Binatia bacterium]